MESIQFDFLGNFKFFLPQILIFLVSIYYFIRNRSLDGILLSMGSGISILILIYHLLVFPYQNDTLWQFDEYISFGSVLGLFNVFSSITYIAGFAILIQKQIKVKAPGITNSIERIK